MTYMRHPLGRATSIEELQAYPFPEIDTVNTGHIRKAVSEAHARGRAAEVRITTRDGSRMRDMIAILQAIKAAGALQAEIEVM